MRTLVIAVLCTSAMLARAQPAEQEARAEFAAGERAVAENDYQVALDHFRRAFELAPHDAVRFNIAVCLERLGRFREAVAECEQAAASTELDEPLRERARQMAARSRERLATLIVEGAPPGASVEIGAVHCTLPCREQLDPGEHEVVVHGDRVARERVTLERAREVQVEIDATNAPVELSVEEARTEPERAGYGFFGGLTAIGSALAGLGIAGIIGFGIATEDLAAAYRRMPTVATRGDGLIMRDFTNASIVIAGMGGILVAIDVLMLILDPPRDVQSARRSPFRVSF